MITIKNYENYFLLYTDGELSEQEMDMVQEFVDLNPELAVELDALIATKLELEDAATNTNVDFSNLYKNEATSAISLATMIDLLHEEIAEPAGMQALLQENKVLREEWNLLQKTRLEKEPVVFIDKDLLYKQESTTKPVYSMWRLAAAAMFIGVMLLGGYKYFSNEDVGMVEFVKKPDTTLNQKQTISPSNNIAETIIAVNEENRQVEHVAVSKTTATTQQHQSKHNETDHQPTQAIKENKAEQGLTAKGPVQKGIEEKKKIDNQLKENNQQQSTLIANVDSKENKKNTSIKKEIIDVDLSTVFAEATTKNATAAGYSDDESTILYMKTAKLKDTKIGMAFGKIKKAVKNKIAVGEEGISFRPIEINL